MRWHWPNASVHFFWQKKKEKGVKLQRRASPSEWHSYIGISMATTCGVCPPGDNMRKCSICQGHLCRSLQEGARTVCAPCITAHADCLAQIFCYGKDAHGDWLDPASRLPVPTCQVCDSPLLPHRCSLLSGCSHTDAAQARGRAAHAALVRFLRTDPTDPM